MRTRGPSPFSRASRSLRILAVAASVLLLGSIILPAASEYSVASAATNFSENFDGVVAPALPPGWTTVLLNASNPWTTTTTTPDTAPNAAFAPDLPSVSDSALVSPSILMCPTGASRLTFRNKYDLESGFDGGVLEISINGGPFTDIVTAGGSFAGGGYNATISNVFGNPLGGRQGWSGKSSTFVTTTPTYITTALTMPAAGAGFNIQLRWRLGTDSSVGAPGWWVDTILLSNTCSNGPTATSTSTSTVTLTPTPAPPTATPTITQTRTITPTATITQTRTITPTSTQTPLFTATSSATRTPTTKPQCGTFITVPCATSTPTATNTPTPTRTPTVTPTPTRTGCTFVDPCP